MLAELFGSEARVKILALFALHPAEEFYLREIAQKTGLPVRAVQRVVRSLTEIGLLHRERRGNSVYFSANPDFPIFPELKALFLKTVGLGDQVREALASAGPVDVAFIYGSYAKNQENVTSDVDLFVVGQLARGASPPPAFRTVAAVASPGDRGLPEGVRDRLADPHHPPLPGLRKAHKGRS